MSEKTVYPRISGLSSVIAAAVILLDGYVANRIADLDAMIEYAPHIGDEDESEIYERMVSEAAPYVSALDNLEKIADEDEITRIRSELAAHGHVDIRI